MSERLAGQPTRANFRTGTLTVCTMVPMRSVPHRVVCLLGLDDGVYPRASAVDGDNVLARRPLTGERDLRSEDRQLMLDAIMATQEHLVVTYSGANETNGQPRPPAVPLGELLDALDDTVTGGRAHALRAATPGTAEGEKDGHPLQAFDPCNFRPPVPFSFDRASLAGARAALRDREPVPSLADTTLPAQPADDLELASLVTFFRHPVRAFLRDRLGVALPDEGEEVADGLPVELDNLQQWGVGDRLLRDLLRGRTPDQALGTEWRRGVLPPGRLGWRLGQSLTKDAGPVAEMVESVTQGQEARAVDVDVDLGAGRRLRGTVSGVHDHRVVSATFSRLGPRQWLEAWIPLLALCATHPGRPWSAGAIGRGEKGRHGCTGRPRRTDRLRQRRGRHRPAAATWSRCTTPACARPSRSRSAPVMPGQPVAGPATTTSSPPARTPSSSGSATGSPARTTTLPTSRSGVRTPRSTYSWARRCPARSTTARPPASAPSPCVSGDR